MISELLMMMMLLLFIMQVSSLWTSLLLVPFSFGFSVMCGFPFLSGLLFMLVIMVFVGGLLVLLVGVASISYQDQSPFINPVTVLIVILFYSFLTVEITMEGDSWAGVSFMPWLFDQSSMIFLLVLMLLLVLVLVTGFLLNMKSLFRSV